MSLSWIEMIIRTERFGQSPMGTHTAQEQMGRPQEMSQERFQRGVDPADEGQEVPIRSQHPETL